MKKLLFILFVFILPNLAFGQTAATTPIFGQDACILVEEEDGSPANWACLPVKVTNGTLTDNGSYYSLSVGSSSGASGVTAGSYNAANITVNSSGGVTFAAQGQLTSLSDVGSSTKTAGNYLLADGANFKSVSMTGDTTQTSAGVVSIGSGKVGATQIASTSVTAGSYNAANITTDADGRIQFAAQGQLTSLSDVSSSTKTAGNILIANGTNFASMALSGRCVITSAGVASCTNDTGGTINAPTSALTVPGLKYTNNATWNACECFVDSGTSAIFTLKQCNGSGASCANVTNAITCATTSTAMTFTGSGVITALSDIQQSVGTVTGSVNNLRWTCSQTQ